MKRIKSMLKTPFVETLRQFPLILVGFGAQGRAEAHNLKRSGASFKLALRPQSQSWAKAHEEGFDVVDLQSFSPAGACIALNVPDQAHQQVAGELLKRGHPRAWVFAHGFSTHFKTLPMREGGPAHLLVAPKGAAHGLMEFYQTPQALPAILALENSRDESTLKAWAESYALGIGCHPQGLIWARFRDETECDLFSEQALLCGGVSALLKSSYEVMVEAGYHPEAAYFESLYELKLIVDLIWKDGITGMRNRISPTARYGDITRGPRVIDSSTKEKMKVILSEIQSGKFAEEFLKNIDSPSFKAQEELDAKHPLEEMGRKIRDRLKKPNA
jgi:ketol-acid reductoisomerase